MSGAGVGGVPSLAALWSRTPRRRTGVRLTGYPCPGCVLTSPLVTGPTARAARRWRPCSHSRRGKRSAPSASLGLLPGKGRVRTEPEQRNGAPNVQRTFGVLAGYEAPVRFTPAAFPSRSSPPAIRPANITRSMHPVNKGLVRRCLAWYTGIQRHQSEHSGDAHGEGNPTGPRQHGGDG